MRGAIAAALAAIAAAGAAGCGEETPPDWTRADGAWEIAIDAGVSLQNPAWSPEGDLLLCTLFRGGYNRGAADLLVVDPGIGTLRILVQDGSANVNLPGSAWSAATHTIAFSSSREPHDEIFAIADSGMPGDETRITDRAGLMAYEPSLSPDGAWVVFESHPLDVEGSGVITKALADGTGGYVELTASGLDCRQPNWSPAGGRILYQRFEGGSWDIWVMNEDGTGSYRATDGPGDETDASFSPDGSMIVFSSDSELDHANIYVVPVEGGVPARVTSWGGYDGAPSWSPDGTMIAFESRPGDPDGSAGTRLFVIEAPAI